MRRNGVDRHPKNLDGTHVETPSGPRKAREAYEALSHSLPLPSPAGQPRSPTLVHDHLEPSPVGLVALRKRIDVPSTEFVGAKVLSIRFACRLFIHNFGVVG